MSPPPSRLPWPRRAAESGRPTPPGGAPPLPPLPSGGARTRARGTDRGGRLAELEPREGDAARIGGPAPIPLLGALVGWWPGARFTIDVKDEPAVRPLAGVLERTAAWDRVCITSFSARRLAAVRRGPPPPGCPAPPPPEPPAPPPGRPPPAPGGRRARRSWRRAPSPPR